MSKNIFLYPFMDIEEEGFSETEFEIYYAEKNEEEVSLKMEVKESVYEQKVFFAESPSGKWNPSTSPLKIKIYTLINSFEPFYKGPNKIADEDTILGLGIRWICKESSVRGAVKPKEYLLKYNDKSFLFEAELNFLAGEIKGSIEIEINLFVGTSLDKGNKKIFANKTGMLVARLDTYKIIFEGQGSSFPIVESAYPGFPLWWVECTWNDIAADLFDTESFRIVLNSAHKEYEEIEKINMGENNIFLREIYSESMLILLLNAKKQYLDIKSQFLPVENGSVAEYIEYLITTFDIDLDSSIETISKRLKEITEERLFSGEV